MQTLVVKVAATGQGDAHAAAVSQARAVFGDRFIAVKIAPTPLKYIFQATLSLTSGTIEEWQTSAMNSLSNRILGVGLK